MNDDQTIKPEDYLQKLELIVDGLNNKYPSGNTPFQLVARLCEEAGELAKAVNHVEGTGIKIEKYGAPDREQFAKEIQDVLRSALAIAKYYDIKQELEQSIDTSYRKLVSAGFLDGAE